AVADLPLINQNLNTSEGLIDKLLKDPDATWKAINTPGIFKEGTWAAWGPGWVTASEDTKTLAGYVDTLMSTLAGEGLRNVKNVRNRTEFQALADSLTAGLKQGRSKAGIIATLEGLKQRAANLRKIALEQAGKPAEEEAAVPPKDSTPVKRRKYNDQGELVD